MTWENQSHIKTCLKSKSSKYFNQNDCDLRINSTSASPCNQVSVLYNQYLVDIQDRHLNDIFLKRERLSILHRRKSYFFFILDITSYDPFTSVRISLVHTPCQELKIVCVFG